MGSRIDVVVGGAEGRWLARALRDAGHEVAERIASGVVDGEARLIVIDLAQEGAVDAVKTLVARKTRPWIVAVGLDEPDGVDVFRYPPIAIPWVLDEVARLVPGSRPRPRSPTPAVMERPVEPTVRLTRDGDGAWRGDSVETEDESTEEFEVPFADARGDDARGDGARGDGARGDGARGDDARGDDAHRDGPRRGDSAPDGPAVDRRAVAGMTEELPAERRTVEGRTDAGEPDKARKPVYDDADGRDDADRSDLDRAQDSGVHASSRLSAAEIPEELDTESGAPVPTELLGDVPVAELSPRLMELLRLADRRIFPNEPPLDLRLRAGEETPRELVPDALLAPVPPDLEPGDADLDGFTFLGVPSDFEPPARATRTPVSEASGELGTPATRSQVISTMGGAPPGTLGHRVRQQTRRRVETQHGRLATWEGLGLAFRLSGEPDPIRLTLVPDTGERITVLLRDGAPVGFEGPDARLVVDGLAHEGRLPAAADPDAALRRALEAGLLDPFEYDRRLRRAREALLGDALLAPGTFDVTPALTAQGDPLLVSLARVGLEAARRHVDVEVVRRLGAGRPLSLSDGFREAVLLAGIAPELVSLLRRLAGVPLGEALEALDPTVGLPGLLVALLHAGALELGTEGALAPPRSPKGVQRLLERAHLLAVEGDYFAILDVPMGADPRTVAQGYRDRIALLRALPLEALGLGALEEVRQEALVAVEEAWQVLRQEHLRLAYARALGG